MGGSGHNLIRPFCIFVLFGGLMGDLLHKELTGAIIGAYYEVYNHTSRVYPESIYELAMMEELQSRGLAVSRQDEHQVFYKDHLVGVQRLDLTVVEAVMVENKVALQLKPIHKAQGLSYLKTIQRAVGLLFNFGSPQPEFDRLYYDPAHHVVSGASSVAPPTTDLPANWLHAELVHTVVGALYEVHMVLGSGFIHRIYANAYYHELTLRGLTPQRRRRMQVSYKGKLIGDTAFGHLVVEGVLMVFPVATEDIQSIHLDNLKIWMRANGIGIGVLANFCSLRLPVTIIRA